jgi:hypothetical protein
LSLPDVAPQAYEIGFDNEVQDAHRVFVPEGVTLSEKDGDEDNFDERHVEPGQPKMASAFPYSGEKGFQWWTQRKKQQPDFAHPIPPM